MEKNKQIKEEDLKEVSGGSGSDIDIRKDLYDECENIKVLKDAIAENK